MNISNKRLLLILFLLVAVFLVLFVIAKTSNMNSATYLPSTSSSTHMATNGNSVNVSAFDYSMFQERSSTTPELFKKAMFDVMTIKQGDLVGAYTVASVMPHKPASSDPATWYGPFGREGNLQIEMSGSAEFTGTVIKNSDSILPYDEIAIDNNLMTFPHQTAPFNGSYSKLVSFCIQNPDSVSSWPDNTRVSFSIEHITFISWPSEVCNLVTLKNVKKV